MSPSSIRRTTCSTTAPPIGGAATEAKAVGHVRFCLDDHRR
jgi:hypothetical protein